MWPKGCILPLTNSLTLISLSQILSLHLTILVDPKKAGLGLELMLRKYKTGDSTHATEI
jgi:hypothetical protein